MHRLRVSSACFSLLLLLSPATRLMWLGGCALLLWAAQASAGQASLAWDAVSAPTLAGYRLYYGQTSRSYATNIDVGLQTTTTVTSLTTGQTYYFAVTAYDSTGTESPFSNEVSATIGAPVAAFSASPTTGPAPLPVQFTDTSTGSINTWAWSFGDGTSSTTQNPQHTYSTTGTYTVSLTVSGPGGANTATKVNYITVKTNPTGLVAAYSFDEGSGTTVTDVSGYGNNGTITGATWTTAGKFGGALSFNGTSTWITVNDAPSLDLTTGMTLEAWVYPTVKPTTWSTVLMKEQPGEQVYSLYAGSPANRPNVYIYTAAEQGIAGPSALPRYTWSHVAGTYDGTTLRLYVNGTQVRSQAVTGSLVSSTGPLRIGGNSVWGEYFRGRIDEVRIYNRALSAPEIQADMSTPINVLNSVSLLP